MNVKAELVAIYPSNIEQVTDSLTGTLTISGNLSDLVKILEGIKSDTFEQSLKEVVLDVGQTVGRSDYYSFPDSNGERTLNKIKAIKAVRDVTGWGLAETKFFVEGETRSLTQAQIEALNAKQIYVRPR